MILEIFDRNHKKIAYLENAFNIKEDLKINSINYLNFSIPLEDKKVKFLEAYNYVKCENRLYRILPKIIESDEIDILNIECEHVLATLLNDVIFGHVIYGNIGIYTKEVIEFILNKQHIKNWKLGKCEFSRQFEYAWENENLASALFSIPKPISEEYIWEFETENYPWTLNLLKLNKFKNNKLIIHKRKNLLKLVRSSDPKQLFTRIYPLGYGEGVNQLTIKDINDGVPYLQSPKSIIDKYGIIETIWIDRRYENIESLKDAAQTMLNEFQEPLKEYELDYQSIDEREKIKIGMPVLIVDGETKILDIIVGISYDYDDIKNTKIIISNKGRTIAGTIADLADRQRIEMSYSQGATQLYAQSIQVNADLNNGAELNFFIPNEMRIINKVIAKIKLQSFRAYSKATEGGGASTETTNSGGGTSETTSFGGSKYPSTTAGGGGYPSTHGAENVRGDMYRIYVQGGGGGYIETWKTTYHEHNVKIPSHSHFVDIPDHRHSVNIPSHRHTINIPNHEHQIVPGIYTFGSPSGFNLKVNGKTKGYFSETSIDLDLTNYLLDNKKRISRGNWQSIEIVPNDLAYVSIDLMVQGFVQSRGDYTV